MLDALSGRKQLRHDLVGNACARSLAPWAIRSISGNDDTARPHFYQTRSAWSVDQGSNKNHSPAYNFAPTVTKFCVMWEGLSLPHDTKFGNCRCKIVDSRSFPSWSLIHGLRWSGLIKVGPVLTKLFKAWAMVVVIIPFYVIVISSRTRHKSDSNWHALN